MDALSKPLPAAATPEGGQPLEQLALEQLLLELELRLLDPFVRRDPGVLDSLLADEFREFGSSGREFDKARIIAELQTESYTPPTISGFEARLLSPGVALVTYKTLREDGTCALRSSIWIEREDHWQVLFHQGTKMPVPG
jgi:hypothetical protein